MARGAAANGARGGLRAAGRPGSALPSRARAGHGALPLGRRGPSRPVRRRPALRAHIGPEGSVRRHRRRSGQDDADAQAAAGRRRLGKDGRGAAGNAPSSRRRRPSRAARADRSARLPAHAHDRGARRPARSGRTADGLAHGRPTPPDAGPRRLRPGGAHRGHARALLRRRRDSLPGARRGRRAASLRRRPA